MAAVLFTHPVDQTKIRSQLQRSRTTMLETARRTVRSSSVMGLWEGITGSLLRQATYGAARFGIYAELKERDRRKGRKGSLVLNGAIAGLVSGIVGAPAGMLPRVTWSSPHRACHGQNVRRWDLARRTEVPVPQRFPWLVSYSPRRWLGSLLSRDSVDDRAEYCDELYSTVSVSRLYHRPSGID
jgi:dicarboxylate transporter 10